MKIHPAPIKNKNGEEIKKAINIHQNYINNFIIK
jgi:hypothetical protein